MEIRLLEQNEGTPWVTETRKREFEVPGVAVLAQVPFGVGKWGGVLAEIQRVYEVNVGLCSLILMILRLYLEKQRLLLV